MFDSYFDFQNFQMCVGMLLDTIDPNGDAIRDGEDAIADLGVCLLGCFNFGMTAEDTALFVLCSETKLY